MHLSLLSRVQFHKKYRYTQFIGETVFDTTGGYNLYTSGRIKTDLTRPIRENWRRRSNRRKREGEKERTMFSDELFL